MVLVHPELDPSCGAGPVSRGAPSGSSTLDDLLTGLAGDGRLVHVERLAARTARHGEPARPLPQAVRAVMGTDRLWAHQVEALDLARAGHPVVVATGTASGKSLCFQAPIAEAVTASARPGSALAVFPTKALAHDQLRALAAWGLAGIRPAAYDGDCSVAERVWARDNANVVFTNPEMLHRAILPQHARWATFLLRLRYVVVDELHAFRGIFGSHVAQLLRRLRRLCARYGSSPTFVFCSATLRAPAELASALCGQPVAAVTDDGSPRGERLVALWNPPLVDDRHGQAASGGDRGRPRHHGRLSSHREAARLVAQLLATGHRTIGFCRSRGAVELVAADVRRRVPTPLGELVRPYRAGYLPAERRQIEDELFGGRLRGVVTTSALELGVDIAALDACVLDGFPGTVASLWQQAGRAGRGTGQSLAVLVAGEDPLDQWYMAHPAELFDRPPEQAVINAANPYVVLAHLACAAFELPLTHGDEAYWPGLLDDGVRALALDDQLRVRQPGRRGSSPSAVWDRRGYPARDVGLRHSSAGEYRIVRRDGTLVGTVDEGRAKEVVHPGAVYLHGGESFTVVTLDVDERVATVEGSDDGYYTLARTETNVDITRTIDRRGVGAAELCRGTVEVHSRVTGYQRRSTATGEVLGTQTLDLAGTTLATTAFWYVIDPSSLPSAGLVPAGLVPAGLTTADAGLRKESGALHAVEHAAIGLLPLFAICDRCDVGGMSSAHLAGTAAPTIVIYDGYAGGAGIAELGYAAADRLLAAALDLIERCGCAGGCPSCVQSPKCGTFNEHLDKRGAIRLLRTVLTA